MKKLAFGLLLCISILPAAARMARPDLVDVPLDQLQARYRKLVQAYPNDAHAHYVLGRLDSMAYAMMTTAPVGRRSHEPFFSIGEGRWPQPPAHPAGPTPQEQQSLDSAISEYSRAVKLKPDDLWARLGLGWCLEQARRSSEAVAQYRIVFAQTAKAPGLFSSGIVAETGGYLLHLLNPGRDAAEIAEVRAEMARQSRRQRVISPILIPLRPGTGLEGLVNPEAGVRFDLDGSGQALRWGWPTPRAGWLVFLNKRRQVESGLQLFGNRTFNIAWTDGYQALSSLDKNSDGWLRGDELDHLAVWCDRNGNGVCEPGEVISLRSLHIVGIASGSGLTRMHTAGFPYSPNGVEYADGTRRASYDWEPHTKRRYRPAT
jgi:tetratricopeptide (TPR) repeat protein